MTASASETSSASGSVDLLNEEALAAFGERGRVLYDEKIKPLVEPEQNGKHIAVHLDTGDYALAANSPDALRVLRQRRPDGIVMTTIVGPDQMDQLAYRMMGMARSSAGQK